MDKEQYEILYRLEEHHWWYVGMQRIVDHLLRDQLNGSRQPRILDAGCGTGGMLNYLRRFGPAVGVDLADEAIALSRRRGLSSLAQGSVEQLPFRDGSFDLVVSFDVIYHDAVMNDRLALQEFGRVLRPGGKLLIRVPAYNWLRGSHDVAVHTRRRYTRRELGAKLGGAGLRVTRLTYVNSFLFPVAAMKRLLEGRNHSFRPDLQLPPGPVNRALLGILSLEARLVDTVSFPWGLSVLALAEKPKWPSAFSGDEENHQDTKT